MVSILDSLRPRLRFLTILLLASALLPSCAARVGHRGEDPLPYRQASHALKLGDYERRPPDIEISWQSAIPEILCPRRTIGLRWRNST